MKYPEDMDKECIPLCDAINRIKGLRTIESCCGHGRDKFRIWFTVKKLDCLPVLLYFCDSCHVGFDWDCLVTTDCAFSPVHFRIESRVAGERAYRQANKIASEIISFVEHDFSEELEALGKVQGEQLKTL